MAGEHHNESYSCGIDCKQAGLYDEVLLDEKVKAKISRREL
jgi:hypothetical protein